MTTEDGTEQAVLHPADVEFLKLRITGSRPAAAAIVATCEETADVGIEVGTARQRIVQSQGQLPSEDIPRRSDIATPES